MSSLVDRRSDKDDDDQARKHRVASENTALFQALTKALESEITRYNERHPKDPNAVVIHHGSFSPTAWFAEIRKTTEPSLSLTLDFPINSGIMKFRSSRGVHGIITLDIEECALFYVVGQRHSVESITDYLLKLLLSPDEASDAPKPTIGF